MPDGHALKRFCDGQQVRIRECDTVPPELAGRTGVVRRLRRADDGAWVRMHDALPSRYRRFCDGDDRENDIVLYPEECEDA